MPTIMPTITNLCTCDAEHDGNKHRPSCLRYFEEVDPYLYRRIDGGKLRLAVQSLLDRANKDYRNGHMETGRMGGYQSAIEDVLSLLDDAEGA